MFNKIATPSRGSTCRDVTRISIWGATGRAPRGGVCSTPTQTPERNENWYPPQSSHLPGHIARTPPRRDYCKLFWPLCGTSKFHHFLCTRKTMFNKSVLCSTPPLGARPVAPQIEILVTSLQVLPLLGVAILLNIVLRAQRK